MNAGQFLRVRTLKKESCASHVTETLEVALVSQNIRQTSLEARPSAKRCEIAPCVTCT